MRSAILMVGMVFWIAISAPLPASTADQPVTMSSLKTLYASGETRQADKILFPDPWPFPYTQAPALDDVQGRVAMMLIGISLLKDYSGIYLNRPAGIDKGDDIVNVAAVGSDGRRRFWTVDVSVRSIIQDIVFDDLTLSSLSIHDMLHDRYLNMADLDDAVLEGGPEPHLDRWARQLGIFSEKSWIGDLWNGIKNKWESMTPCEQVFLVGGIIVCSAAGGIGGGIVCGAVFFIAEANTCLLEKVPGYGIVEWSAGEEPRCGSPFSSYSS